MHQDVFEAPLRHYRQFCIETERASAGIAASPFGLHLLNIEAFNRYKHD
jgi:hypothetical protein